MGVEAFSPLPFTLERRGAGGGPGGGGGDLSAKLRENHPKDPAVLKRLRDSELLRRGVSTTPPIFTAL